MNPILKWFSAGGLLALSACALVLETPRETRVTLSLGEGRALASVGSLPVGHPWEVGLRVETLGGTLVQDVIYTQAAPSYELSLGLPPGQLFRAIAFHRHVYNGLGYLDTKIFSSDRPVVLLRLGHFAQLTFEESYDSQFLPAYPVNFFDNPLQFQQATFNVVNEFVRFNLEVPQQHQASLTTFEYSLDGGPWTSASVGTLPWFEVPGNTQRTLRVRWRQESDGQWVLRRYVIIHDT